MKMGKEETRYFDHVSFIFNDRIYWSLFCKELKILLRFKKNK